MAGARRMQKASAKAEASQKRLLLAQSTKTKDRSTHTDIGDLISGILTRRKRFRHNGSRILGLSRRRTPGARWIAFMWANAERNKRQR